MMYFFISYSRQLWIIVCLISFIDIDFAKRRKVIELSTQVKKFEKIKIFENISWSTLEKIESNKYTIIKGKEDLHNFPKLDKLSRTPPGHPDGFLEAFANIYLDIAKAIIYKS